MFNCLGLCFDPIQFANHNISFINTKEIIYRTKYVKKKIVGLSNLTSRGNCKLKLEHENDCK